MKLAMRCNLACTYCYWFRDDSVYDKPSILTLEAENAYVEKLGRHIAKYGVPSFFVLFHGGEPLLFGLRRFDAFCTKLRALEQQLGFTLKLAITTNGVLLTESWRDLFEQHHVSVTLSIDGPREVHDRSRIDHHGRGTFDKTLRALQIMRDGGKDPGVLSVCNPAMDPESLCEFFVHELGLKAFDFLVPDANYEDAPGPIAGFYTKLFDLWYDKYSSQGVRIRFIESIATGLLGRESHSESIGYGPTSTVTLLTDGSLEPLDVLRTAGSGFTRTKYNIQSHELQDVDEDQLWREILNATVQLPAACEACAYKFACGGGHVASRYSLARRYDNPSVYCHDFKIMFRHAWHRLREDLYVNAGHQTIPLRQALDPAPLEEL
ncbi:MAG: radical SAM protein [Phycisphaerae bacterium]|nr:radical SAM protein [Gemmatimonadaceae bacterium]